MISRLATTLALLPAIFLGIAFLAIASAMPSFAAPLIVAHRGASHDAPENTLAAFNLAWQQGADGIEGDWRMTSDGRLACIHDEDLKRVAGEPQKVSELTFDEIRRFDVGSWRGPRFLGERTPSLAEVLATVPEGKRVFLELKEGPEIVPVLKQELAAIEFDSSQLVVIAFDEDTISACKKLVPELRTHWLTSFERVTSGWSPTAAEVRETAARIGADGIGFKALPGVVNQAFLEAARVEEFHVWTVDDPNNARYFQELGVLGVTTNRPGWLREQLRLGATP